MLPNTEQLANKIINSYLSTTTGEVVLISGGIHVFGLIEDLALAVRRSRAYPVIMVSSDRLFYQTVTEVDEQFLSTTPEHFLRWLDDINAIIDIDALRDPATLNNLPPNKVGACRRAYNPIYRKQVESGIKWLMIAAPSPEKAAMYGVDYELLCQSYARALDVNSTHIAAIANKLAHHISTNGNITVTSPSGTDLTLSLSGQTPFIDDGIIDDNDRQYGFVTSNLPCGELFYVPVPLSVQGTAVFHSISCGGKVLDKLVVTIQDDRIVGIISGDETGTFQERLSTAHGEADRVGEFGIGLNPGLTVPTGDPMLDEKLCGSVHLGLGDNTSFGGDNHSDLHWDLVILEPTITAGHHVLCQQGQFLIN